MKKKTIYIIGCTLIASLLLFCGCGKKQNDKSPNYSLEFTGQWDGEHDYSINFDGVLDEEIWNGKTYFTNTFAGNINGNKPSIEVTGFTGDHGVYIGATAYDNNLKWTNQGFLPGSETFFEFYIVAENIGEKRDNDRLDQFQLFINLGGLTRGTSARIKRGVSVDGVINSEQTVSATWEIFVPWQELEIDTSLGIPDSFGLCPDYRAVKPGTDNVSRLSAGIYSPQPHPENYFEFDKTGYLGKDLVGAKYGNSKIDRSKTANWEVVSDTEVRRVGGYEWENIYLKDSYSGYFTISATIIPNGAVSDESAYAGQWAGFYLETNEGYYFNPTIDFASIGKSDKNVSEYQMITLDNFSGGWHQVAKEKKNNPNYETKEGVDFLLIKNGGALHYFFDGEYYGSEKLSQIVGSVYVGFFSLNENVTYKNIDYCEYDNTTASSNGLTREDLSVKLEELGVYSVAAENATSGGRAELSSQFVSDGDSITVKVTTANGKRLSSLKVNGIEKIEEFRATTKGEGVYEISNITENLFIEVSFENASDACDYKGFVTYKSNKLTVDVTLTGAEADNKELFYTVKSLAQKGFSIKVPKGRYTVKTGTAGAIAYNREVNISENITDFEIALTESIFPDMVAMPNGNSVTSALLRWDLSKESENIAIASYEQNSKMSPIFFGETGVNAIIETDIEYTGEIKEQPDVFAGFFISDGKNSSWITARESGIAYYAAERNEWVRITGLVSPNVLTPSNPEKIGFRVIVYNNNFYVYINDTFVYKLFGSDLNNNFENESPFVFGLYVIVDKTAEITFSDFSVRADTDAVLTEIRDTLPKDITAFSFNVTTVNAFGAYVSPSSDKVWKGDSAGFDITLKSGYKISSITVNDEEKTDEILASGKQGSYSIDDIQEDIDICITVDEISKTEKAVYSGVVQFLETNTDAKMVLQSKTDGLIKYRLYSTATGFEFYVPVGEYTLTVEKDEFLTIVKDITLNRDVEEKISLNKNQFASKIVLGKNTLESKFDCWNLDRQGESIVSASYQKGAKDLPLWFKQTGKNVIVETDIEYTGTIKSQKDLVAGIKFSDGINTAWIAARLDGYAYVTNTKRDWYNFPRTGILCEKVLTPYNSGLIHFKLVVADGDFYAYINDRLIASFTGEELGFTADGEFAFSLHFIADTTAEATFSNYSVRGDSNGVTAEIEGLLNKPVDYLFIGDSYFESKYWLSYDVEFLSLSSANENYPIAKTYFIEERASFYDKIYNPSNIIFSAGIDDVYGDSADFNSVKTTLDSMIKKYAETFPDAKLYWISVPPNNYKPEKWNIFKQINEYMKTKAGVNYIDVASEIGSEAGEAVAGYYLSDGSHLNEKGYEIFVRKIKECFNLTPINYEYKHMRFDDKENAVVDFNKGNAASYFYLNREASASVYLGLKFYSDNPNAMMGFTLSNGRTSVQFYFQNVGVCLIRNYTWSTRANLNETGKPFLIAPHAPVSEYFGNNKTETVEAKCFVYNGYIYVYFNNVLNIKIPLSEASNDFNNTDTFYIGVTDWDCNSNNFDYIYSELDCKVGGDADAVIATMPKEN